MGKCCICGKEGVVLSHGLWWCEEHRHHVKKETSKAVSGVGSESRAGFSIDLGLKRL